MARRRGLYLLQNCSIGYSGNSPMFWRTGGGGYTPDIDEAQRWTYEDARRTVRSTRGSHRWHIVPLALAEKATIRVVDQQRLAELMQLRRLGRSRPKPNDGRTDDERR